VNHYLFSEFDLRAVLESHERKMLQEIDEIDPDEFLNTPPTDLAEHFIEKVTVQVPVLHYDKITSDQDEAKVDVSQDPRRAIFDRSRSFFITGTQITLFVPFEGDAELFKCKPSTFSLNPPTGVIRDDELLISYTLTDHDAEALKAALDNELNRIKSYMGWIANDVKQFNDALAEKVRPLIDARREKLLKDRDLVASLGYPMRVRKDAPLTYVVPTTRRKPPAVRPTRAATAPFEPEPTLDMEEYERILGIMSSMVQVIERSPGSFKQMKEEDLRQHFLVQLNGQYEGQATGETFNFEGKTDILVRAQGKNVFIAECKFWNGPKSLQAAVDQLLGYASWRDTKTAIILFNRGKALSNVLAKVPEVMKAHPNFKREIPIDGETSFRYVFHHRDDPSRELIISVLVFEVPA
jgi:hypothetical protein